MFVFLDEIGVCFVCVEEVMVKCVMIVGVGLVGFKIVEMLLCLGIYYFIFVDGDVMLFGNLECYVFDWWDVGFCKVYGLKWYFFYIVSGVDI